MGDKNGKLNPKEKNPSHPEKKKKIHFIEILLARPARWLSVDKAI